MEISEVRSSLRDVENFIFLRRKRAREYKAWFSTLVADLNGLAATYADVITEINGYTPTGATETLCKDLLAKLIAERSAFLSDANQAVSDLGSLTEF